MGSNSTEAASVPVHSSSEHLSESPELVRQRSFEVDGQLELGNRRNHVFPVLSGEEEKKSGTLVAELGSLWRIQVRPELISTHGPLRSFLNRQNMLSRHTPRPNPRTDSPLGLQSESIHKGLLPTDRLGGPMDQLATYRHALHSSAETASHVNAESANWADMLACMKGDTRKTFWERLTEAWGRRSLPTTQLGIAEKLGMSQGSVGRWARGEGLPELDVVRTLALEGDVCIEWLLTGRGPRKPQPMDEETIELLEVWSKLNSNGRHHVRIAAQGALSMQTLQSQPSRRGFAMGKIAAPVDQEDET
jgi:hypothetical protein